MNPLFISLPENSGEISGRLEIPKGARALLVLAHGAGAGMFHPWMEALAGALRARDVGTLRFQFPYVERGSKRPDSPELAMAAVAAAVRAAEAAAPQLPLFAGGKSFGGRMTTNAAARDLIPEARGLVCFGFPLHPAKRPGTTRAAHLADVQVPTLFLQGTRDALAETELIERVVKGHASRITLHFVRGADHSFSVLKSSGRTSAQALDEVADVAARFCLSHATPEKKRR